MDKVKPDQVKQDEVKEDQVEQETRHLLWKSSHSGLLFALHEGRETLARLQIYRVNSFAVLSTTHFGKFNIRAHDLYNRHLTIEDEAGKVIASFQQHLLGSGADLEFTADEAHLKFKTSLLTIKYVFEDQQGNPIATFGPDRTFPGSTSMEVFPSALTTARLILVLALGEYMWIIWHNKMALV